MKGGDILDFLKGGNLRKGGVDPEKGGYDPPYQLCNGCWGDNSTPFFH